MGERALWPVVVVILGIFALVFGLARSHVDAVNIIALMGVLFTGVGSVISMFLYNKVSKIDQNVNGNQAADKAIIRDYIEHLKGNSTTPPTPPVSEET